MTTNQAAAWLDLLPWATPEELRTLLASEPAVSQEVCLSLAEVSVTHSYGESQGASMPYPALALAVVLYLLATSTAWSSDIVIINNGLAPPTPANVINASNRYPTADYVVVQNAGCDVTVESPCYAPGAPTTVRIESGGTVGTVLGNGQIGVFESSALELTGGEVNLIALNDSSTATISGGTANSSPQVRNASRLMVIGGIVRGGVAAIQSANVTISGGTFTKTDYYSSTVYFYASESSTITVVGTGFLLNGSAVGYGAITATSGRLTGTLLSGDPIDVQITRNDVSSIVLAPTIPVAEPSSALLLSSAVIGLVSVWRKSRREQRN